MSFDEEGQECGEEYAGTEDVGNLEISMWGTKVRNEEGLESDGQLLRDDTSCRISCGLLISQT